MKQQDRMHKQLDETRVLGSRLPEEVWVLSARDCLTEEVQRTLKDLSLTARSITAPQAHFEQLMLTESANGRRTGAALDDAVAQESVEVLNGRDSASGSGLQTEGANPVCRDSQTQLSELDGPPSQGGQQRRPVKCRVNGKEASWVVPNATVSC